MWLNTMDKYKRKELEEALQVISSIISQCEKTQLKFSEGTSQHTLLTNRIKAMYISKSLIVDESAMNIYSKEELIEALIPVSSLNSKCEKARIKFVEGTSHRTRLNNITKAMGISKSLITNKINKR